MTSYCSENCQMGFLPRLCQTVVYQTNVSAPNMFKIWQTKCIKWNKTDQLNFSHSMFIPLTKRGKTLFLIPWNVPPTQIISPFYSWCLNSFKKKTRASKCLIFFYFEKALRWSDTCGAAASSAFCTQPKINLSWHLSRLRYLFPKIKLSWLGTEVAASSFGSEPPTMQHCAETVWVITNTKSHSDECESQSEYARKCALQLHSKIKFTHLCSKIRSSVLRSWPHCLYSGRTDARMVLFIN